MTDRLWALLEQFYAEGVVESARINDVRGHLTLIIEAAFTNWDQPATEHDGRVLETVESRLRALNIDLEEDFTNYPADRLHIRYDICNMR
jgi:hypothetical protein